MPKTLSGKKIKYMKKKKKGSKKKKKLNRPGEGQ